MSSELEQTFIHYWRLLATDQPEPTPEHKFMAKRRFRFDFAFVGQKLAIEIEGGTWMRGRHNRAQGFEQDCSKYNLAVLEGWRVLRYTGDMLKRDPVGVIEQVKQALAKAA